MSVKLLTEHHLEFLSLKGGCAGSSESTLVEMPHCWKSHVAAQNKSCEMFIRLRKDETDKQRQTIIQVDRRAKRSNW